MVNLRNMKFSIVIPAHNEAEYVGQAIKTVLGQDYPRRDFEIIVVDNNSEDETAKVAKSAGADKVVKETNQGTNSARERGFKESKGEIIAFLDADCEAPPDWLQKIERSLKASGVAAVSGPYNYGFAGFKKRLLKLYFRLIANIDRVLYFVFRKKTGIIFGGNFAVWKWAIQKIGGLPPLKFWGDDTAIAMVLSRKAGRVIFDPTILVKSSPRRFYKTGFLELAVRYIWNYLKIYFRYSR